MEEHCYLREEFFINCSNTTQPPTAYLMKGNLTVTEISLDYGELRISNFVGTDCYNAQGNMTYRRYSFPTGLALPLPYTISDSKNKFYAVGCNIIATLQSFQGKDEFITGCLSVCNKLGIVDHNSCPGAWWCQTSIPSGLQNWKVKLSSLVNNHSDIWNFNSCSYAFIAEQGQFSFSPASLKELNNTKKLPMVLNWAIGNDTDPCDEAQKRKDFPCTANIYSRCFNRHINGSVGYLCRCLPGHGGNPYHPDGCQGDL